MTWEYLETQDSTDLPRLGAEGWELVAVVPEGAGHKYVFKRPAADLKPRFSREQVEAFFAGRGHPGPEHASPLLNPHVASLIRRGRALGEDSRASYSRPRAAGRPLCG